MKKGDILISKSGNEYILDKKHAPNIYLFKTPFSKTVATCKLLVYKGEPIHGMFGELLTKKSNKMATKKKKGVSKKNVVDTTEELRAQMKKNGVVLPHGYKVVKAKRKPKATRKKKSTKTKKR